MKAWLGGLSTWRLGATVTSRDAIDVAPLTAATQYLTLGWSVIPLEPRGKRPAVIDAGPPEKRMPWECYQTRQTRPDEVERWSLRWPDANIGIVAGAVSGVIVADFDGPEGAELKATREIPPTPTARTGKGWHVFFKHPGGEVRNFARKLPGLDLRGDGGYVVAAPSIHGNGSVYAWEVSPDMPLADPPAWLMELIRPPASAPAAMPTLPPRERNNGHSCTPYGAKALDEELAAVRRTAEGGRNEQLNRSAFALGQLVAGGELDRALVEAELFAAALACGLTESETKATIRSGLGDGEKEPRRGPQKPITLPRELGARVPTAQAEKIVQAAGECPAPEIRAAILDALMAPKTPVLIRRQHAGRLALGWLEENGGFVQAPDGELYYFSKPLRRLFNLASEQWGAFLYVLSGCNPASTDFAYLMADCKSRAIVAPCRPVVRVAAYDIKAATLRVSRFDGTVYVLDGESITTEANGEHVLFADDPTCPPYNPDFNGRGALAWLTEEVPSWPKTGARRCDHGLAFRAWGISTFFPELCPSKPLVVFLGEKGSGKSTALRLFLRLLFGPRAELYGVPDKPDGFTAAASSQHVLGMDNLDEFTGWIRDKLARIATGTEDSYRKLYTSNEAGRVTYRCYMAFTSRTPETLRRDDLADRLLILPVERIDDDNRRRESELYADVETMRDAWWGEVLTLCNRIIAAIRRGELGSSPSRLRLADWEALGRLLACEEGREEDWNTFCREMQRSQSDFLLEDDPIVDGLRQWAKEPSNIGQEATARKLYGELTTLLFGDKKPDAGWPKSPQSFSKRLANIRRDLQAVGIGDNLTLTWGDGTQAGTHHRLVYKVEQKTDGGMEG